MPQYKVYAGLGGGFGGSTFRGIFPFQDVDEAEKFAHDEAVDEYEMYAGMHGLDDYDSIYQEFVDNRIPEDEIDEGDVELALEESMDSWLDYHVELVSDDYELTEGEIYEIN